MVRAISCAVTVMLGACGFSVRTESGDAPDAGAKLDAPGIAPGIDTADGCYGPSGWTVCPHGASDQRQITGVIDTDATTYCSVTQLDGWPAPPTQPAACFVVGGTLTLTDVTASGSRPLVFVATGTISVVGVLDVGSHFNGTLGPGSPASQCRRFKRTAADSIGGGGGGAGGSFGTRGGDGGTGNAEIAGGDAADADGAPGQLRAGCAGQTGGETGGAPGQGGGAVYLVAGISITGPGTINASGSGGHAAGNLSGGSGGGTGGMIVLSAPVIALGGAVANGGGAASGANAFRGGASGSDVNPLVLMAPALGGVDQGGSNAGGSGGDGSFATAPGVKGSDVGRDRGGGGGGGGVGMIRANVTLSFPVSPPASLVQ